MAGWGNLYVYTLSWFLTEKKSESKHERAGQRAAETAGKKKTESRFVW